MKTNLNDHNILVAVALVNVTVCPHLLFNMLLSFKISKQKLRKLSPKKN